MIMYELIKKYEGCRLEAYRCPAGKWTIGYGHTEGVEAGDRITQAEADFLLERDANAYAMIVERHAKAAGIDLTANQLRALTSFAYNVGTAAFFRSTLWRMVCEQRDNATIAAEFRKWVHAGGKVLPGLVKRREDEARIFCL